MTAVASDQTTSRYGAGGVPNQLFAPQKALGNIYGGTIVVLDAGYAAEGRTALGLIVMGVAVKRFDNSSGANGDKMVVVDQGVFPLANSAGNDQLTQADVGKIVYLVDNITVAKTNGSNTRSPAGRLMFFNDAGVPMVQLGLSRHTSAGAEVGSAPAYTGNDLIMLGVVNGAQYDIPATTGASTVTLPAAAPVGTSIQFTADGTKNAHTVQYRDATGSVNLTTALTASKRHLCIATKGPGGWSANAYVSP